MLNLSFSNDFSNIDFNNLEMTQNPIEIISDLFESLHNHEDFYKIMRKTYPVLEYQTKFTYKLFLIEHLNKVLDLSPGVIMSHNSLYNLINSSKSNINLTRFTVWFQRYINTLANQTNLKFFKSKDILSYIIGNSMLLLYLNIDINRFEFLCKFLASNSYIYEEIHKKFVTLNNFNHANLKFNLYSHNKIKLDFMKLSNMISKYNDFLNDYAKYIELKKHDPIFIFNLSGIISHLVDRILISFYMSKNKKGENKL